MLTRVKDGSVQQYTYDGNGNVSELVDGSGNVVAHYEYDPYGNSIVATGADNPFRFSSKYLDAETGLYYYGCRYYSPVLGRWLSRDPLGQQGGLNLYGFAFKNGISVTDYLGQNAITNALSWTGKQALNGAKWTLTGARVGVGVVGSTIDLDLFRNKGTSPAPLTPDSYFFMLSLFFLATYSIRSLMIFS